MSESNSLSLINSSLGLPTGIQSFDNFLLWRGLPKNDLSLIYGHPGTGATSLWLAAARQIENLHKSVAWISNDWEVRPQHLESRQINPQHFTIFNRNEDPTSLFEIICEVILSCRFEMIACYEKNLKFSSNQLFELKKLAKTYEVSLILIGNASEDLELKSFALIIECQKNFFKIQRAEKRPVPFCIPKSMVYQFLFPQFTQKVLRLVC
jgi:hypothetical protein